MKTHRPRSFTTLAEAAALSWLMILASTSLSAAPLARLQYNNPGLVVDLGVGLWAWPLPMDWDGDGDLDLVVSCPDVPFNGIYLFENPGGDPKMPVFRPPARLGPALKNVRLSYIGGRPRILTPGKEWIDFLGNGFSATRVVQVDKINPGAGRTRANQWHYVDYDGDGALDVYIGIGYWGDYGWDNAFDDQGQWTRGPLHGYVYLACNRGTTQAPDYEPPVQVKAAGEPVDVYGMPSPCFADFDADGDLDLICGEFLDGITYFRNVGTRTQPRYAQGRRLDYQGAALAMNVQMITPTAIDWDDDGDVDLVVGDEDGRVALVENTGQMSADVPVFLPPQYFQQEARDVKFGALVTPVSVDWDADGDEDLICGNTAGHIAFIENLEGGNPPKWARPRRLEAGGQILRIQAGPNGSIQGPCEAKWGYTTLSVADWDHDGLLDLVVNSIWGKVIWFRNIGTRSIPRLAPSRPVTVQWQGDPPKPAWNWWNPKPDELATQWRTTPCVIDWNQDGLNDLVMLDHEGYLAFFQRRRRGNRLILLPGRRVFEGGIYDSKHRPEGEGPLRLNNGAAGSSGRRKLCIADWDGDGRLDLLVNSTNVAFLRNVSKEAPPWRFENMGDVTDHKLAGHTTSPTIVDFDRNNISDLLIGAEDGRLYHLPNSRTADGTGEEQK